MKLLLLAALVSVGAAVGTTMCHGGTKKSDPPCYCNPNQTPPPQCVYNGAHPNVPCPKCGTSNCTCPLAPTTPTPSPGPPAPSPGPPAPSPGPPAPSPGPPTPATPSPPGPERPGMIYNGTCLPSSGNGGDCNAMRAGTFKEGAQNLADCTAKIKKCKYGNYAIFNEGPYGCGWAETCPFIGTPRFCVDCSKPVRPDGQCAALQGKCPGFIQFMTEVIHVGPPPHPPLPDFTCSTPAPSPGPPPTPLPSTPPPPVTGTPWEHVGPWNIFDDKDNMGEAGTLNAAASPKANPNLIYAGGHNNGVSSGILKSVDGGNHWTRNSKGIWDTRIWGVFIHPSDPQGSHVLAGTQTGIYESKDGAASWQFLKETAGFGAVISFAEVTIGGKQYIVANHGSSIASVPMSGGLWNTTKVPGTASWDNNQISTVTTAEETEILACMKGGIYYGAFITPTNIQWSEPINYTKEMYVTWSDTAEYRHRSYDDFWDSCPQTNGSPKDCKGHWHWVPCKNDSLPAGATHCSPDGQAVGCADEGIECCRSAVINGTDLGFKPAAYLMKAAGALNPHFSGHCFASDNFKTWTAPRGASEWDNTSVKQDIGSSYPGRGIGSFPVTSTNIKCNNAAVDPNDRDHFMYSDPVTNFNWDSHNGGTIVRKMGMTGDNTTGDSPHSHGAFYVAIDARGWSYSAGMGGAYVSRDNGTTFESLHMVMNPRGHEASPVDFPIVNRVVHDYQGISNFRGGSMAFPSDQGLGILDGNSNTLINAVGDLHNNMAMSALISPSKDGKSRNIVVNLWDWNQAFTVDDGATWRGWAQSEAAPYSCGEGGWGFSMGKSGYQIMFHHSDWWHTSDGGHNFVQNTFPGSGGLGFDYIRKAGSLSEPIGTCFSLMGAPAGPEGEPQIDDSKSKEERDHEAHVREKRRLNNETENERQIAELDADPSIYSWLLTSENFGLNFTWTVLPDSLQTCGKAMFLAVDPTKDNSLYVLMTNCLAHSTDKGKSWTPCITAPGLEGPFTQLHIKNTKTMFMMRTGKLPLRTVDGGATWAPLTALASIYQNGASYQSSLSWTGKTLVVHGNDRSAISRQEFGTIVWKSTDDGETWTDETGDLVTLSTGHGKWYESDFYFVTQGQGVVAKRNFE